jgi:uncharacterized protein (DUF305 family)
MLSVGLGGVRAEPNGENRHYVPFSSDAMYPQRAQVWFGWVRPGIRSLRVRSNDRENRMKRSPPLTILVVSFALGACSGAIRQSQPAGMPGGVLRRPVSDADVRFMSGMIPHHAQAVLIAGWAPSHGARVDVRTLCERIVVAQRDEIALMQNWLRDQGKPAPPANATHMKMTMNGVEHDMLMPGMLNDEELKQLDAARGADFDRLFLQAMIRHHQGAIQMVDELFASYGAAQDETVFRFGSDVYADQTTEIARMEKMLAAAGPSRTAPPLN